MGPRQLVVAAQAAAAGAICCVALAGVLPIVLIANQSLGDPLGRRLHQPPLSLEAESFIKITADEFFLAPPALRGAVASRRTGAAEAEALPRCGRSL